MMETLIIKTIAINVMIGKVTTEAKVIDVLSREHVIEK